MTFNQTGELRFVCAIARAAHKLGARQWYLTPWTLAALSRMRCYLSEDEQTGYAVTEDGELTCLFNVGYKGRGRHALGHAFVHNDARKLSVFDSKLVGYYENAGWQSTRREPFEDTKAPEGWPYDKLGRPDVVYMERPVRL